MGIQHNSNKFTLEKHKMTKKASNDLTSQCGLIKTRLLCWLCKCSGERAENTHALWMLSAAPQARLLCPNPFFCSLRTGRTLRAGKASFIRGCASDKIHCG